MTFHTKGCNIIVLAVLVQALISRCSANIAYFLQTISYKVVLLAK